MEKEKSLGSRTGKTSVQVRAPPVAVRSRQRAKTRKPSFLIFRTAKTIPSVYKGVANVTCGNIHKAIHMVPDTLKSAK